ncbi:hypothetical protein D3C80_1086910 [compost metagenome]
MIVAHEQVRAFHQLNAHLPCQEGMLEKCAVEAPRRQYHHTGVVQRARTLQGIEQQIRIVIDRSNALGSEQLGKQTHHHLTVFEHVADAAGGAQVVFKHVIGTIAVANQVHTGNM